ncbi:carboxypeptidase-like regulatory domain-containing protein [Longimicrobium terrae]|uniref:Carboxypeptidase regulatory-like domain-containing protein n=1 Tax=Longimicrobium terrae TaxID=1639882 RepID=A0A841H3Y9_9BACT|nr:carboxypeptidase-like regulatory domain-containing protein [Longimicrobium terrae]MBB4638443.1 hypothetical protein [Longimicrobium terrae]MBB6072714.1 hypothetical protein [Longimicrobium terrae]NNC32412.1 carboxypeptidase regulatory-like domain-containing protein [Longimicrobium terrae]
MPYVTLRRALHALLLSALLPAAAAAQSVSGRVLDLATGQPVAQAAVSVLDQAGRLRASGQTDGSGRFLLLLDSAATVQLRGERIGYRAAASDWLRVGPGSMLSADLRLPPSAVTLSGVTITARQTPPFKDRRARNFFIRAGRGVGSFVLPEVIDARRPGPLSTILQSVPRMRFTRAERADPGEPLLPGRGGGTCVPTIYVNGAIKRVTGDDRLNDLVDPNELWGVEVYEQSYEAPAELPAQDPDCGVIVVWTQRS